MQKHSRASINRYTPQAMRRRSRGSSNVTQNLHSHCCRLCFMIMPCLVACHAGAGMHAPRLEGAYRSGDTLQPPHEPVAER